MDARKAAYAQLARLQRAKNLTSIHNGHSCPLCERAVMDVTAPACWRSVELGKAAREAVNALKPAELSAFRQWAIDCEAD